MNAAEDLAKAIIENYDNPLQDSTIDVPAQVESLLHSLGATSSDSGGKVTYYGLTPSRRIDCRMDRSAQSRWPPRGEFYQDLLRRRDTESLELQ